MVQGNVARSESGDGGTSDRAGGGGGPRRQMAHWEAANAAQRMSLNPEIVALLSRPYHETTGTCRWSAAFASSTAGRVAASAAFMTGVERVGESIEVRGFV